VTVTAHAVIDGAAADSTLVRSFDVAPAELAESRALQQRVDRKYLLATGNLELLLRFLRPEHLVLLAGHVAWARYDSLYFDLVGRELYHAHRRGLMPRYKVRIRHHLDRQLTFLEIKRKERSGRTAKWRLSLPFGQVALGTDERLFIDTHTPLPSASLVPTVSISFKRLTLLGRAFNERVTLDQHLTVTSGGRQASIPPAVIAEVKQPRFSHQTDAVSALRSVHAREMAFSKYCLGTLLSSSVRGNVFRPLLHALDRISACTL
jgi:hypothetical protein